MNPLDNNELWRNALAVIELSVSGANFKTWFHDTLIVKQDDGIVIVGVPSEFAKDWLWSKYHKLILKTLRDSAEHIRGVDYMIVKPEVREKIQNKSLKQSPGLGMPGMSGMSGTLPLQDHYVSREGNLNPRYTFDSFVVGPFNENAHAAAQAVIKNPGHVYNPLFIYGSTGHGKTHLIQAIGNHIKTANPDKKVFYVTSEKFTSDIVQGIQTNKIASLKEKYRAYDVFIMDDIQFMSGREKTEEELFHLFNSFHDANKQIVFSSDKHPNFISGLEDRLKSRFNQGLIIDIPAPDHESRAAILKTKAQMHNFELSDDVLHYLASTVEGNIRELEGALNAILSFRDLKSRIPNISEIKNIVKNNMKPKKMVSVKDVVKVVSDFYNIEEKSILDKTRRKEVVKPRQVVMYLLREDFSISYPTIGEKLGGRDHTTVIHSCEKVKNDIKTNSSLVHEIEQIRSLL